MDYYVTEELSLANAYFDAALNRQNLAQLVGMMLATELMVPGRMEKKVDGWRRVGLADTDMTYLIEHITVDIEHAHGWMNEVVLPMIEQYPNTEQTLFWAWKEDLDTL